TARSPTRIGVDDGPVLGGPAGQAVSTATCKDLLQRAAGRENRAIAMAVQGANRKGPSWPDCRKRKPARLEYSVYVYRAERALLERSKVAKVLLFEVVAMNAGHRPLERQQASECRVGVKWVGSRLFEERFVAKQKM